MSNYQSNPIIVAIDKMNKQEAIEEALRQAQGKQ